MLFRSISPRRAHAAVAKTPAPATSTEAPTDDPSANSLGGDKAVDSKKSFWSSLTKSLAEDPLFQPADMQLAVRDPFTMDEEQSPLPVLFAEDRVPMSDKESLANKNVAPTGLELRSTIVGRTRRAAMINGQLYQVGKDISANGHRFRLTAIESHRVVLTAGDQTFELKLARPRLLDVLNRERNVGQSDDPRTP